MKNRIGPILVYVFLLYFSTPVLSAYTDIIVLHNGDRITGEVKGLVSGQLELKTEYMGTVFIDWENIQDLVSNIDQQIELGAGFNRS